MRPRVSCLLSVELLVVCLTLSAALAWASPRADEQAQTARSASASQAAIPEGWQSHLERPDILKLPVHSEVSFQGLFEGAIYDRIQDQGIPDFSSKPSLFGLIAPKDSAVAPTGSDSSVQGAEETRIPWQLMKAAHFSFIAQLLATYPPETQFYFLARDAEYLYDVARLVSDGTANANRIHLLNISSVNARDPNLKAYLAENGLSEQSLTASRDIVLVDTGFSGSVARIVREQFSLELRSKLKVHLALSTNPEHPSSRGFLYRIGAADSGVDPIGAPQDPRARDWIRSMENLPRYTGRSTQYFYFNDRWHPIGPSHGIADGPVSKEMSLALMHDLQSEWARPEVKERFRIEFEQIQRLQKLLRTSSHDSLSLLRSALASGDESRGQSRDESRGESRGQSDGKAGRPFDGQSDDQSEQQTKINWLRVLLADLFDSQKNSGLQTSITAQDLGFELHSKLQHLDPQRGGFHSSHRRAWLEARPHLIFVLNNPQLEIPKLIAQASLGALQTALPASNRASPESFAKISAEGNGNARDEARDKARDEARDKANDQRNELQILRELIDGDLGFEINKLLAREMFSDSYTHSSDPIEDKSPRGSSLSFQSQSSAVSLSAAREELQLRMVQRASAEMRQYFAQFVFSQPHTKTSVAALSLLIERSKQLGDTLTLRHLAQFTFSKPHTAHMVTPFRMLVESVIQLRDLVTLRGLAHTFSKPHVQSLVSGDLDGDRAMGRAVGQAIGRAIDQAIDLAIELAVRDRDFSILREYGANLFTARGPLGQQQLKWFTQLIRGAVAVGDRETQRSLQQTLQRWAHVPDVRRERPEISMLIKVLADSVEFESPTERRTFLLNRLNQMLFDWSQAPKGQSHLSDRAEFKSKISTPIRTCSRLFVNEK